MLTSSLTDNQVVAATMALGLSLMLWFADAAAYLLSAPGALLVVNLSLIGHFTTFVSGSLFLSDAGYYVTLASLALFITTRVVATRCAPPLVSASVGRLPPSWSRCCSWWGPGSACLWPGVSGCAGVRKGS